MPFTIRKNGNPWVTSFYKGLYFLPLWALMVVQNCLGICDVKVFFFCCMTKHATTNSARSKGHDATAAVFNSGCA